MVRTRLSSFILHYIFLNSTLLTVISCHVHLDYYKPRHDVPHFAATLLHTIPLNELHRPAVFYHLMLQVITAAEHQFLDEANNKLIHQFLVQNNTKIMHSKLCRSIVVT